MNSNQTTDARQQLDATLGVLDGGVAALSPAAARSTIERWLDTLADHDGMNGVATVLGELRAALAAKPIDGGEVGRILERLGEQTTEAADQADDDAVTSKIERLGGLLASAGRALGRSGVPNPRVGTADDPGVVQENSSAAGPMPQGSGTNADIKDVKPNAASRTPGTKFDPK
ncbi:MAG: hypothetical protein ABJF88_13080 [Rhodothermales bacterium]